MQVFEKNIKNKNYTVRDLNLRFIIAILLLLFYNEI